MSLMGAVRADESTPLRLKASLAGQSVILSWRAFPGRIYDIASGEALDGVWTKTNIAAVRAESSIAQSADSGQGPVRYYQVAERSLPPGNTGTISSSTVAELEKVLGLTFSSDQRSHLASVLTSQRSGFEIMRGYRLANGDQPPFHFNPAPSGLELSGDSRPSEWSPPRNTKLPAVAADLGYYSVRDLGEMIRTRNLTSLELTRFYLERLKRHDATLHCVITLTEELALEQAARADAEISAGHYRGPLHGIPYGIKDLFAVRGYPTTWGAAQFRDQLIDEDASVYRKLKEAGAVLIAKLATGELAYGDVWFGERTRNPWNPANGSGGSSAGPASAVAAGLVAFAIGTETYGSLVSPATSCRITTLRPTFGRISRAGAMTLCWSMDKVGPMCRFVEDCAIVLDAIRGKDVSDVATVDASFGYSAAADLSQLRVGYLKGNLVQGVLNRIAGLVGSSQVTAVALPKNPVDPLLVLRVEAASSFDELVRVGGDAFLQAQSIWPNELRAGQSIPAVEYLQANRLRKMLIEEMNRLEVDVIIATDAEVVSGQLAAISNLTGQPCVVIPHGGGSSLGFVGRPFSEATLLALARTYQEGTSFHTPRPPRYIN